MRALSRGLGPWPTAGRRRRSKLTARWGRPRPAPGLRPTRVERDPQVGVDAVEVAHVVLTERVALARLEADHEVGGVEVLRLLGRGLEALDERDLREVLARAARQRCRWIDGHQRCAPVGNSP